MRRPAATSQAAKMRGGAAPSAAGPPLAPRHNRPAIPARVARIQTTANPSGIFSLEILGNGFIAVSWDFKGLRAK
jgi:hypothetical protein